MVWSERRKVDGENQGVVIPSVPFSIGYDMDVEALISATLREAGYGPDAIGSALPRIMRILQAEDVRIEMGRSLSRKEREYVRLQLELGLNVSEIVAGLKA